MNDVELATLELGRTLREREFGQRLREIHPSRRAGEASFDSLAAYELSSGPAVRRTFHTLEMTNLAGQPLNLTDEDREYVTWIGQAWLAMRRIAGRCWRPIPPDVRLLVIDQDDLGPAASPYIPASREHEYGPALAFAGLDTPEVAEKITAVVEACRSTACHEHVSELVECGQSDTAFLRTLAAQRARIVSRLDFRERLTIGEANQRRYAIVQRAYDSAPADVREFADAVRAYNELVNYVLFAVLGFAEGHEIIEINEDTGPIRCRRKPRLLWVHFASFDPRLLLASHPPSPFVLKASTPLDGLYMLEGSSMRWSGRTLVDVHARRMRELEERPPAIAA
ncbi:MAG TPA: hypothetical protein VE596_16845 [Gaiellaceae bacterium]|nr:hypothetical protein [Gaiellaceae bacterium]